MPSLHKVSIKFYQSTSIQILSVQWVILRTKEVMNIHAHTINVYTISARR